MEFRPAFFLLLLLLPAVGAQVFQHWRLPGQGRPARLVEVGPVGTPRSAMQLHTFGQLYRSRTVPGYVPIGRMPACLTRALLWQEDQSFRTHRGYSLREMLQAALWRLRKGRLRGASTITQQLARTLFLNRARSARRKLLELRISRILEKELGKDAILELYLNHVYWGRNRRGVLSAARFHFGVSPERLNNQQCAFLVSLLPNPDACRRPGRRCQSRAIHRRAHRLERLLALGREP